MHNATLTTGMKPPSLPLTSRPSTYFSGFPGSPETAGQRHLIVSPSRLGFLLTHSKQTTGAVSNRRSDGGMCNIPFALGQCPRNSMQIKEIIANRRASKAKCVVPAFLSLCIQFTPVPRIKSVRDVPGLKCPAYARLYTAALRLPESSSSKSIRSLTSHKSRVTAFSPL
jgi:hypothetical protein